MAVDLVIILWRILELDNLVTEKCDQYYFCPMTVPETTRAKGQSQDETLYPCKLGIKFKVIFTSTDQLAASQTYIGQYFTKSRFS